MKSGVYKITNVRNGKFYIGSAVNFRSRWSVHVHHLTNGTHHNKQMQSSWNKHGRDSFKFEVVLVCDKKNVVMYEQIAIDAMAPHFNACPIAGSSLGYRHTEETKKLFKFRRKSGRGEDVRKKISDFHKGKVLGEQTKAKIANAMLGVKHSEQRRKNQSAAKVGILNTGRSKPVVCVDTGAVFASGAEAARWVSKQIGKKAGGPYISKAANGHLDRAYGYSWVFK